MSDYEKVVTEIKSEIEKFMAGIATVSAAGRGWKTTNLQTRKSSSQIAKLLGTYRKASVTLDKASVKKAEK